MSYAMIGTAGHVDHGKTELIKAITGTDTDRLTEEKARGISIELGFAFLELPSGQKAGIVDVPGHERFIKNMLAGVGGIDLALLVVAADEGIMPQTKEHVDILSLLGVKSAVVAVTKVDLVDSEWQDMIEGEVSEFLEKTTLKGAPVCFVSAKTGQGLQGLLNVLDREIANLPAAKTSGPARLPIDRVFTMAGFGTVVTGTLVAGQFCVGENVEINPGKIVARIRTLQVHGGKQDKVDAPSRVAVNLSGVDMGQLRRGYVISAPETYAATNIMDVKVKLLADVDKTIKNRARVRIHLGTAEAIARIVLLDQQELLPAEHTYAQLLLEKEIVAAKRDMFVIRSYSPMITIGGGQVINPHPIKHKRFKDEVVDGLAILEKGEPEEILNMELEKLDQPATAKLLNKRTGISERHVQSILHKLDEQDRAKYFEEENHGYYIHKNVYEKWLAVVQNALKRYHREYPLRDGLSKEELRSKYFPSYNPRVYQGLLMEWERDGAIRVDGKTVRAANHKDDLPELPSGHRDIIDKISALLLQGKFQPPDWKTICNDLNLAQDQEYLQYLLRKGILVKITGDIYWHKENLESATRLVSEFLHKKGSISVGEARDLLGTSRKHALPLLEHFDKIALTKRVDDLRVLK